MPIAGRLDIYRKQITSGYLDIVTLEVRWPDRADRPGGLAGLADPVL